MKGFLSTGYVEAHIRKKHDFKKIGKHMEFADFETLMELEAEKKWWKIVRDQVDFIFERLTERSHRFKFIKLKQYAQIMYSSMFNLKWSPSSELLNYETDPREEDKSTFPLCPIVEFNMDRVGDTIVSTEFYHILYVAILYMRIICRYAEEIEPANECNQYGDIEFVSMYNYIQNMTGEEILKITYMGENKEVNKKEWFTKFLRWITKINMEINTILGIPMTNINPSFIERNGSINLVFLRKV